MLLLVLLVGRKSHLDSHHFNTTYVTVSHDYSTHAGEKFTHFNTTYVTVSQSLKPYHRGGSKISIQLMLLLVLHNEKVIKYYKKVYFNTTYVTVSQAVRQIWNNGNVISIQLMLLLVGLLLWLCMRGCLISIQLMLLLVSVYFSRAFSHIYFNTTYVTVSLDCQAETVLRWIPFQYNLCYC